MLSEALNTDDFGLSEPRDCDKNRLMITRDEAKAQVDKLEREGLERIESMIDKELTVAVSEKRDTWVDLEDFSPGVLRHMPDIVKKYKTGGWMCRYDVRLKRFCVKI